MPPPSQEKTATPIYADGLAPTGGLTYRDLQRAILFAWAVFILYKAAAPAGTLLLLFMLVFILAAVLNPVVVWLQQRGVPRVAGAVLLVAGVLAALGLVGTLAVPPLLEELGNFFANLGGKQERLLQYYQDLTAQYPQLKQMLPEPGSLMADLTPRVTSFLGQVGRYTINLLVGIFSLLVVLVLVIFTLANPTPLITGFLSAVPLRHRERTQNALRHIMVQLKNWAFGSLVLGVIIGLMTGIGLWTLGKITGHHFPYVLLFSVIAGIGELIPNIGPVLSAIPPALVALTIDPILGLWVLVLFIIIQQLENNLIVPVVMGQSLNLHPLSVTFTVLIMGALFGLLGAILAVPVCAIIKVCWQEFYLGPRNTDAEAISAVAEELATGNGAAPQDQSAPESDEPPGGPDPDSKNAA
ncbi:MAG: AI-2E family transporter [Actinomycetota bacterium]